MPEGTWRYCPACDRAYPNWIALREHLKKAQTEGEPNHLDIIEMENWEAFLAGTTDTAPTEEVT